MYNSPHPNSFQRKGTIDILCHRHTIPPRRMPIGSKRNVFGFWISKAMKTMKPLFRAFMASRSIFQSPFDSSLLTCIHHIKQLETSGNNLKVWKFDPNRRSQKPPTFTSITSGSSSSSSPSHEQLDDSVGLPPFPTLSFDLISRWNLR